MLLNVAVLPGDGIGPEVTREAVRMLRLAAEASGVTLRTKEYPIGGAAIAAGQPPLPPPTEAACLASDAVLLGAVGAPIAPGTPPAGRPEAGLLGLRRALGGYANLRPITVYSALAPRSAIRPERADGTNILVVRELLGGLYYGQPRGLAADGRSAVNTMRYTREEVERVARIAFSEAQRRRRHVTSVDKANVLETSQLWRATVTAVARDYPDVRLDHLYVDACALRLLVDPKAFDVVLTENLFGDVLSDEAAAIPGSLGLLPSATLGGRVALYEPVHGSAPDLAGQNRANPIGAIACVAMLLRHSAGLPAAADDLEEAIGSALGTGVYTADLAGQGETAIGTREMGDAIEAAFAEAVDRRRAYHAV